jgi:glutathione S-transferase
MKLYIIPGACSLAANIALREAGIRFELARLDPTTGKADDGTDFRAVNPKGYVPALQLNDGRVLTENVAVLLYVADQNPQAKLAPPAPSFERYRLVEWLCFINSEIHKGFSPLYSPAATEEVREYARNHLVKRLDYLHDAVREAYLLAGQFTIADAYLFTVLGWGAEVGLDMTRWPRLETYRAQIAQRPHVIAALESEA